MIPCRAPNCRCPSPCPAWGGPPTDAELAAERDEPTEDDATTEEEDQP